MEKYNSNSTILNKGDIIVFNDGTKRVIKKIKNDHVVTFEDGKVLDLYVVENKIKGIISMNVVEQAPTPEPFESNPMPVIENKIIPLALDYRDLAKKMFCGSNIEFYHYTAAANALSIIRTGYIYSRNDAIYQMLYDNAKKIDLTDFMTNTNKSYYLASYARFYLNPKNPVTYHFHESYLENNTFGVIIALSFDSLWKAKTHIILTPINAHYLDDSYFKWEKYDIGFNPYNLRNYDATKFNYQMTYETYTADNQYRTAEVLFYNKVSVDNVAHFYFKTPNQREAFLAKLEPEYKKDIEKKCIVNKQLFWD